MAVYKQAQAAFAAREWTTSAALFGRLLVSADYGAEASYGLGMIALERGKQLGADRLFVEALERDNRHANALYQVARLRELGKRLEAEKLFVEALKRDSRHADALYQVARLRERASTAEAAVIYQRVLAMNPEHVSAAQRLAALKERDAGAPGARGLRERIRQARLLLRASGSCQAPGFVVER